MALPFPEDVFARLRAAWAALQRPITRADADTIVQAVQQHAPESIQQVEVVGSIATKGESRNDVDLKVLCAGEEDACRGDLIQAFADAGCPWVNETDVAVANVEPMFACLVDKRPIRVDIVLLTNSPETFAEPGWHPWWKMQETEY